MPNHSGSKGAWLLVCLLALVGCANVDPSSTLSPSARRSEDQGRLPPPAAFEDRETLPACGSEEVVAGVGWNVEARQCLLEAFLAGRPAELVSKTEWEPGEVVVEYLRSLGGGAAEIWSDPSGLPGATRWLRIRGCDFFPSQGGQVGVRPAPVFAVACAGEG